MGEKNVVSVLFANNCILHVPLSFELCIYGMTILITKLLRETLDRCIN